jgi:hypothetical protein
VIAPTDFGYKGYTFNWGDHICAIFTDRDGVFDPDRTLDLIHTVLEDGRRAGYPTMRVGNDVSWLGNGRVSPEAWESFESRLTHAISPLPMVMVCQYDHRQVSGSLLVTALETHPTVILGDRFRENPFHVPASARSPDAPEFM